MHQTTSSFFTTSPIVKLMADAAFKASKKLIRDFGEVEKLEISRKSARDYVSTADLASEKTIINSLQFAKPDCSFISEESGIIGAGNKCFVIDPLDGTINFLRGIPNWCISIAYKESGVTKAGIIYEPLKNDFYQAEYGKGAFLNGSRIRASKIRYIEESVIAASRLNTNFIETISKNCIGLRKLGSIALSLCYTAAGRFDAFLSSTAMKEWDISAGSLIAQEAGCCVRTKNSLFLVSNIEIVDRLETLLK